jgi:hypothetical protein
MVAVVVAEMLLSVCTYSPAAVVLHPLQQLVRCCWGFAAVGLAAVHGVQGVLLKLPR